MKKVLDVVPYPYLPFFSGGQKSISGFLEYLAEETDLTVICTYNNDFNRVSNYKGLPLLKKSFSRYFDISLVWKIISLVKKEKYDTIIWEHPYYAWLAWIVKKWTGVTTVFHTHNLEYQRFRSTGRWWWRVLKVYEKWALGFGDYVFFITGEDRHFAITNWKTESRKCIEVAFGIKEKEESRDRVACRQAIAARHGIADDEKILLFIGLLSYPPNFNAISSILEEINPRLMSNEGFRYKILICGKDLPETFNELKEYAAKNVIYAGFVDDIKTYFKGADLFLNPVQSGGGIKTKMVESIGFGTTVISTETGATGIERRVCGNKLVVVPDNAWEDFANAVVENLKSHSSTPASYYHYYYWGNIITRLKEQMEATTAYKNKAGSG